MAKPGSVIGWKLDRAQRQELLDRFPARYAHAIADHVTLKTNAEAGFWPFFEVSVSGGWENDVEFDDHGEITVTSKSPTGNPQILGAIVTPVSDSLSEGP